MAAINLDIGGNTRQLDRDIQKTVNKVYSINLKTKGDQPLGRITGKVNEFNKSLDASNARVIAFGASAGIIFGLQRAFNALVTSTIEVQKSLQDINIILNVSTTQLNKFGSELFNIAKNTGQSFKEVAQAATEFSRQGLGLAETLKRTNEALILSRLSGLDTVKSVEALTAAVNSFASQAVTATDIVNKFATVDAAFAVSSADLADAISRVGSSASQSGVSLNELIALVTSAQQTTARGGAVIGNSFKTIFTRLQRGKVVDLLGNLGISDTTAGGEIKSTIQLLQELGKVYDTLGAQQQSYIAEQVGGVFQINILKAALADLGKEYSIYNSALKIAETSTDQAIKRNEELNKTYAAQLNALTQNATQLASNVGGRVFGPAFERVVGGANQLLGGVNESDGESVGAVLGKGILDGIGQILSGPGLVIIGGILLKLTKDFAKFGLESGRGLLGLNAAASQQKELQQSIQQILSKNPQLLELALKGEQGLNQAANSLLASLQKQTVELQKQAQVAAQISKALVTQAGVRVVGGVPTAPTKAGKAAGYIPNFAQGDFAREELLAASLGAKNPTAQLSKGTIDGKKFIKNNREIEITGFGKNGDSAVIPTYGTGFIPNFVKTKLPENISLDDAIKRNIYSRSQLSQRFGAQAINQKLGSAKKNPKDNVFASRLIGSRLPSILTPSGGGRVASKTQKGVGPNGENVVWNFPVRNANRGPLKESIQNTFGSGNFIDQWINSNLIGISGQIATAMGVKPAKPGKLSEVKNAKGFKGAISSTLGTIFDSAITTSLDIAAQKDGGDFDIRGGENVRKPIAKLFGENALSKGKSGQWLGDIKISSGPDAVDSMISKTRKEWSNIFTGAPKKKLAFSGYIPNFAAIQDAVARERAAGIPSSQIYLAQEKALTSANPMGLGVFNKKDEPTKGSRKDAMRRKGFATGYIPNFAEDVAGTPLGPTIGALVAQLGFLAFTLKDFGSDLKTANLEVIDSSKAQVAEDKKRLDSLQKGTREHDKLSRSITKTEQNIKKWEGGKIAGDAIVSSIASAVVIAGPIIGQTIKNLIGSETKGARVAGSAVEGVSQAASFAALAAQIAPKGKGKAAGVTGAIAAILTFQDVLKQAGTNLPELSRASDEASQKLTEFENIAQQANTTFEQISQLRGQGQSIEAGKLESKILSDISSQVTDTAIASQMQRAFYNKDQEALKQAIEENTKVLREQKEKTDRATAVESGIQNIKSLQPGFLGSLGNVFRSQGSFDAENKKREEKTLKEARNIFGPQLFGLKNKEGKALGPGQERLTELQGLADQSRGSLEGYANALERIGYDSEQVAQFVKNEALIRPLLLKVLDDQINSEAAILRNTEAGNPIVKRIVDTLGRIRSKYDQFSDAISTGLKLQIEANLGIRNSLGRINVAQLQSQTELAQAWTGEGSAASRQAGTMASLAQIDQDFSEAVREPLGDAMKGLGDILLSSVGVRFSEMATPGKDQATAEKNFATLQKEFPALLESLNVDNIDQLLGLDNLNLDTFQGFDTQKIIQELTPKIQGDDAQKGLDDLEKKLNQANSILADQRRLQQEQKTLLAQQKFTEIAKLFITAAKTSFGGFEGFLKDNFTELAESLNSAAENIKIIGDNPQTREGQIQFGRELGILTTELSKIAGMNIGASLDPSILNAIQGGQAKYIEDSLNSIFTKLEGTPGNIAEAFRTTIGKPFGLGSDASTQEIAQKIAEAQTKAQYEIIPAINQDILKAAADTLGKENSDLAALLKDPASAFLDPTTTQNALITTSNTILKDILEELRNPEENKPDVKDLVPLDAKGNPMPIPPPAVGSAAGGYFPMFANSKEFLAKGARKEIRDQSKFGYSGGKPLLLGNNFDPKNDAILTPPMMQAFGSMFGNVKSLNAAGGSMPQDYEYLLKRAQADIARRQPGRSGGSAPKNLKLDDLIKKVGSAPQDLKLDDLIQKNSKFKKLLGGGIPKLGRGLLSGSGILSLALNAGNIEAKQSIGVNPQMSLIETLFETQSGMTNFKSLSQLPSRILGKAGNVAKAGAGKFLPWVQLAQGGLESFKFLKNSEQAASEFSSQLDYSGGFGADLNNAWQGLSNPFGAIFTLAHILSGGNIRDLNKPKLGTTPRPDITAPKIPKEPVVTPSRLPQSTPYVPPNWQPVMGPMGPKNASKAVLQARSEKEINAQLMRWQMGTSAEFKNYDKDYNYTGIKDVYSTGGASDLPGSRIDLMRQINSLNDQIKSSRNPGTSMALARKVIELKRQFQSTKPNKVQSSFKIGEGNGAQTLIQQAVARGESIVGKKASEQNLENVNRAIVIDGKIVGYSNTAKTPTRFTPKMESLEEELGLGLPKSIDPANLGKIPDKTGDLASQLGLGLPKSIDPANLGKLERTIDKEEKESGLSRKDIYPFQSKDLRSPDNPEGIGVGNLRDEKNQSELESAIGRNLKNLVMLDENGRPKKTPPPVMAGGYFPNFADTKTTSNNINISVGVNINANAVASNINKEDLASQIKNLLEVEVPKLNALQARVDRMGDVVTKVQNENPGKYNLPPKQIPK